MIRFTGGFFVAIFFSARMKFGSLFLLLWAIIVVILLFWVS